MSEAVSIPEAKPLIKLDLGCGPNKQAGHVGVDIRQFDDKVDVVADLTQPWPWEDNSVESVHCSHNIEHYTAEERIHFVNELWRVLKPDGKALVIVPHWCSNRAYGDLTHKWPPVSEMWFYYLNKDWRAGNAPHNDKYTCHFDASWNYSIHPAIIPRNAEFQQHAMAWYKEVAQDIIATLVAKKG